MAETEVKIELNQQQLELVDRTLERGVAKSREDLFRLALDEFWNAHFSDEKRDPR